MRKSKEEAEVIRRENIGQVYFAKEEMAINMTNHLQTKCQDLHIIRHRHTNFN